MTGNTNDLNKNTTYKDYQGNSLPNHDGTMIEVKNVGFQFFDLEGNGFIHDGKPKKLANGNTLYFLYNGKAIIHDGSPLELPNGMVQHFDDQGFPIWPINEKKLVPLMAKQRKVFFEERIKAITKNTPLEKNEIEELRLALMACEHPDYLSKREPFDFPPEASKIKASAISKDTEGYLLLLKGFWCAVWRDYQIRHRETLSARFVLRQNIENNCLLASYHLSESMLAGELKREFKKADKEIDCPENYKDLVNIGKTKSGIYMLDDRLMKYFSCFGWGDAAEILVFELKTLYKNSAVDIKKRISDWQNPLFLYRCIANVVWFDVIKPKVKTHYTKASAIPLIVSNNVQKIMRKGATYNEDSGELLDYTGQKLANINKEKLLAMPSIDMATMQRILRPENVKVLSSVNSHRLFRWEVTTVTNQVLSDKIDARHIFILGGYTELAKMIGAGTGRKSAVQVRDILLWQSVPQQFRFIDPETGREEIIKEANMISFEYTPSGFKNKASLEIVVGTMLMPHYLYKLIKTSSINLSSESLKLVPIVPEPQLVGRLNEHGSQLSFQMETVVEIRKGAKDLARYGCVPIPKQRFDYLAAKAGVYSGLCPKVHDAWLTGGKNAPPFLKVVEKDHYAFADHLKQVQDFIIQGGEKELTMSKAGKFSVAKKAAGCFKPVKNKRKRSN